MNILKTKNRTPYDAAYDFLEAVKRAWPSIADGSAPQLENILLASSFLLAEAGQPVTKMQELLTDKTFRDAVLAQANDEYVTRFFIERFDRWGKGAATMVESTLRRVFLLTFSPVLRYTLGQKDNLLDFRRFMDEGISVIYDLGGIDNPDARRLLGCLITVGYETAALSRSDIPGGVKARRSTSSHPRRVRRVRLSQRRSASTHARPDTEVRPLLDAGTPNMEPSVDKVSRRSTERRNGDRVQTRPGRR